MGKSWTPLWSTIVNSSLWGEPKEVKILFVTMLALKDADGVVWGSMEGMARASNMTPAETKEAMKVLESPDARVDVEQEHEGRRVERLKPVEGDGWRVLNHAKYRNMIQSIKRKVSQAEWQERYRKEIKLKEEMAKIEERAKKMDWLEALTDEQKIALLKHVPATDPAKAGSVNPENPPGVNF